ncbi:MAG: hypothetical protein ACI8R4_002227 [Paracoccaceae bacterium]|jgi:hypothetical protein
MGAGHDDTFGKICGVFRMLAGGFLVELRAKPKRIHEIYL